MNNMSAVNIEVRGNVGIIKGNNPPVNALGHAVRQGLADILVPLENNTEIMAILLMGNGSTFFAGADISEFGKPTLFPDLSEVVNNFESSSKPIIAAMTSLGTPNSSSALSNHFL